MKSRLKKIAAGAVLFAAGGAIGALSAAAILDLPAPLPAKLIALLVGVYAGVFAQIVFHEAGHLFGGLMSGYKFMSFRVGSFMLMRTDGRMRLHRFSLAGTGGQCLMAPPELRDGRMPVMLYNISGPAANIISAAALCALYFLLRGTLFGAVCLVIAVIGLFLGLMNGIPMRGAMDNDGRNALSLGKNPAAMRALWVQLKINELTSAGIRLKDMPGEYFEMPDEEGMNNALVASLAVFRANRMLDAQDFSGADALMRQLMSRKNAVPGIYAHLMTCDRIFCAAVSGADRNTVEAFATPEYKKIARAMRKFPPILRTEITLALIAGDTQRADKAQRAFDRIAEKYPYPGDIASERELIETARISLADRDMN